jgi:hypothetical protein
MLSNKVAMLFPRKKVCQVRLAPKVHNQAKSWTWEAQKTLNGDGQDATPGTTSYWQKATELPPLAPTAALILNLPKHEQQLTPQFEGQMSMRQELA